MSVSGFQRLSLGALGTFSQVEPARRFLAAVLRQQQPLHAAHWLACGSIRAAVMRVITAVCGSSTRSVRVVQQRSPESGTLCGWIS